MSEFATVRRENLRALFRQFQLKRVGSGEAARGLEGEFAASIDVALSTLSVIKGGGKTVRNIGDKLARQIEHRLGLPVGWLDVEREDPEQPSALEERFVEAARIWYRTASSKERRELLHRFRGG